jgi:hypothetical protein
MESSQQGGHMIDRKNLTPLVAVTVASLAYYGLAAMFVLDGVSRGALNSGLSATVQSTVIWSIAETVAMLVPFLVVAVIVWVRPGLLPPNIWIAPLASVVLPITLSAMWNLFAIGSLSPDFYIGGPLAPEAAAPVQLVAAVVGSVIIAGVERFRRAGASS